MTCGSKAEFARKLIANELQFGADLKYDFAHGALSSASRGIDMNCRLSIAILAVFLVAGSGTGSVALAAGIAEAQQEKQPPKSAPKPAAASLTGCVDERDGRFVLVDDRTLSPIADLAATEGFPQDGFAKHMGHKVTVRGTSIPRGTRPLFQVRSVETISNVCEPEPPRTGK
jgi:hypothetical protein